MDGATYNSKSTVCCGGVGRNLAEGVAKILGGATFISANGEFIKNILHPVCNTSIVTEKDVPTANCSVIFDKFGECKIITADMGVHRCITPEMVLENVERIKDAPVVVFDANLSVETIETILEVAKDNDKPAFFEPTDMRVSEKPFVMPPQLYTQIKFATPNLYELRNMAKFLGFKTASKKKSLDPAFIEESEQSILTEVKQMASFMSNKVDNIIITLGSLGVVVARHNKVDSPFFNTSYKYIGKHDNFQMRYYPSVPMPGIINVSGAGDSFSSGLISAMVQGLPESICVSIGFEAANRALMSKNAVAETYFNRKHKCWSTKLSFREL
uniref:CSON015438 protein n=1 Tax=Culicoides sonorensis TaxID=179676 RepID=A0A336M1B1_CULSO